MPYKDINKRRKNTKEQNRRKKKVQRAFLSELKENTPCFDCKVQYPSYVMHFDHLPELGVKSFGLAKVGHSWRQLRQELTKCQIVCANCHAKRTHCRRQPLPN